MDHREATSLRCDAGAFDCSALELRLVRSPLSSTGVLEAGFWRFRNEVRSLGELSPPRGSPMREDRFGETSIRGSSLPLRANRAHELDVAPASPLTSTAFPLGRTREPHLPLMRNSASIGGGNVQTLDLVRLPGAQLSLTGESGQRARSLVTVPGALRQASSGLRVWSVRRQPGRVGTRGSRLVAALRIDFPARGGHRAA